MPLVLLFCRNNQLYQVNPMLQLRQRPVHTISRALTLRRIVTVLALIVVLGAIMVCLWLDCGRPAIDVNRVRLINIDTCRADHLSVMAFLVRSHLISTRLQLTASSSPTAFHQYR